MKIRTDFVTNSSSSSFIVMYNDCLPDNSVEKLLIDTIRQYCEYEGIEISESLDSMFYASDKEMIELKLQDKYNKFIKVGSIEDYNPICKLMSSLTNVVNDNLEIYEYDD